MKQLQHDFRRNGLPAEQCVKLVERRHHRVPDLRAVLRLRREIGGVQLVAHVFQRFIRMDAFQQRQDGLDGVVRRLCRLQAALERQKRLHHLLSTLFQRAERLLRHALGIAKRLAHGLAAHIRPFAIRAEAIQRLLRQAQEAALRTFQNIRQPPSGVNRRQRAEDKAAQRMRARLAFFRHICRKAVHRQNVLQQRAVPALFGIDDRHLRNVLPHRRQTAYSRRRQMHLLPLSARREQLNRRRLIHAGRCAQRVQSFFHEPDIPRRVQLRIQRLALHGDSAFLRQPFQPLQAEIDRRKEPSVRCGVRVRLDGQRQCSAERRDAQQLRRKRRRNHVKTVYEHILPLEHAGGLEPRAHLPRYILRVGQFARHPLLVGRVDPRNIAELDPRGAFRVHAFGAPRHVGRRQAAALERRDHVGHARREAG